MQTLLALLPLLSIFVCLFVWKQTALRASVASYGVIVCLVYFYAPFALPASTILHMTAKGALICLIVGYVLFFGMFLFHLMNEAGAIASIASFISHATSNRVAQTLLLCFGLCPLIESVSGFGIGFMVVAPIFLALGFPPMQAALLSFIGLLASAWGALATGTIIGSELTGLSLANIGSGTAFLSMPIFVYFMMVALYMVAGKVRGVLWRQALVMLSSFSGSIVLFSLYVSVELAGVLASIVTTACGLLLLKEKNVVPYAEHAAALQTGESMLKVFSPYLFLTICILLSRVIPTMQQFLQSHGVLKVERYSYKLAFLYSPGFWLFCTCMFTIIVFRLSFHSVKQSLRHTCKQWLPFALTTTMFISLSEIMAISGMHALLAQTAGDALDVSFIFIAPLVGAIGGFLTGSNAGSNAMFMKLQVQTAQHIGVSWQSVAISQNTASSISTIACPARSTLGAHICAIPHRENELLRKTVILISGAVLLVVIEIGIWYMMSG
ncbi:L-lactate permease [Ectobacillus sp. JY-23]|uniref:L-lactate permease n=1 Tax=Ectobacillus sp. JY-23 TaxID=2933872 RepID=UPI001FF38200|nr:L-lactate permease [Ectobacillus sp. JY-23]UOY92197.1 L-lactate permease [Ectobacillus sp. JY-23]